MMETCPAAQNNYSRKSWEEWCQHEPNFFNKLEAKTFVEEYVQTDRKIFFLHSSNYCTVLFPLTLI
jgi:hypothetical protein